MLVHNVFFWMKKDAPKNAAKQTIQDALAYLKRREWCDKGTWLVVITNALAHDKIIDTLQLRQIE